MLRSSHQSITEASQLLPVSILKCKQLNWRRIMQNQASQFVESDDILIPLSENEQNSIQGGVLPIMAIAIAARLAAPYVVRGAVAAGSRIANGYRRSNEAVKNHPLPTTVVSTGAGAAAGYYFGSRYDQQQGQQQCKRQP
jgi:hypothetical protein